MSVKKCHYCNSKLGISSTIDHIVPLSRGGEDSSWNKVKACTACNSKKASLWPTCGCSTCRGSVARHAAMGTVEDRPRAGWVPLREKKMRGRRVGVLDS